MDSGGRITLPRKAIYGIVAILALGLFVTLKRCHSDERHESLSTESGGENESHERASSAGPKHDMDMTAGDGLKRDFAHKDLRVLAPQISVTSEFAGALTGVYQQYASLRDAVFEEDEARIKLVAARMRRAVESIDDDGLDDAARNAWQGHRQVMRTALHQLQTASGIDVQRVHLSHISEAMYCALKSFSAINRRIFVVHCPMAFDGRGAYWLSDRREFQNPYMGEQMPSCGTVRETLEPASPPAGAVDFRIDSRDSIPGAND